MKTAKEWVKVIGECGCRDCVDADLELIRDIRAEVVEELASDRERAGYFRDARNVRDWWDIQQKQEQEAKRADG